MLYIFFCLTQFQHIFHEIYVKHRVALRSENCRKFTPANRRHHNWGPIHQSSMLRGTIDAIGQCG